jgi:hypothetical protein
MGLMIRRAHEPDHGIGASFRVPDEFSQRDPGLRSGYQHSAQENPKRLRRPLHYVDLHHSIDIEPVAHLDVRIQPSIDVVGLPFSRRDNVGWREFRL